jgi:hypothetical protein
MVLEMNHLMVDGAGAGADVYAHIGGFVVKEIREGVHLDVAVLPSCDESRSCYKRDLVTHTKETY